MSDICLPFGQWPARDRQLWLENTTPRRPFERRGPAKPKLAPASLHKVQGGYRRWLGFLASRGWLDPDQAPGERLTAERLCDYFDALKAQGNADYTSSAALLNCVTR